jgi:hypothetical protein
MLFWFKFFHRSTYSNVSKPWDCPQLPAENSTTEHAEHTETRAFFFRGFCVVRG